MIRFIGGPARCGKSTLARKAEQYHAGQSLSLDNLRASYEVLVSPEIYAKLKPNARIEDNSVDEWLSVLRKRDQTVWTGAKAYLDAASNINDDVLMEGCLWPDYVDELNVDYRAVFLVDTSPQHVDRIVTAARGAATHNNWQAKRSDEWLRKWAAYNIERSRLYTKLAKIHGHAVFDVGEMGFEEAQKAALNYLFEFSATDPSMR